MLNYYEQIIQGLTSGVVASDKSGGIITANPAAAEHLNVSPTFFDTGAALDALPRGEELWAILQEVLESGAPVTRRTIIITQNNGTKMEIGLSASPLQDAEGVSGVVFLFTNMTERRNLERSADLNQQMAQLGELTAGVVHELRNPLSVICGNAELIQRHADGNMDISGSAESILREALDIERAISQFLGFAKPYELQRAPCYPTDIVERVLSLSQRRSEHQKVAVEPHVDEGLPSISADVSLATQAVVNLVNNAIDASPEGAPVTLDVSLDGDDVLFSITDTAGGIHLEPGEDLFKPFFTRKEGGTGLGLSIVHRIVTAHGGEVGFRNVTGDVPGAQFEIRLPIRPGVLRDR